MADMYTRTRFIKLKCTYSFRLISIHTHAPFPILNILIIKVSVNLFAAGKLQTEICERKIFNNRFKLQQARTSISLLFLNSLNLTLSHLQCSHCTQPQFRKTDYRRPQRPLQHTWSRVCCPRCPGASDHRHYRLYLYWPTDPATQKPTI